ncbi:rRNA maturation RNase YbeY, partial [bacterium]|nr:rRNA maturation RNase YbeY [bacterium]
AKQKGNDLETEINYLIIHGYLHIFGFRHDTDKQEAEMNKEEDWILAEISDKLVIR